MKLRLLILIGLLLSVSLCFAIPNLQIVTEEYPPFNFVEDGVPTGIFIDVLDYILKDTASKQTIKDVQVLPWARGYNMAQTQVNTVIFGTTFTEERKNSFKWVGPVVNSNQTLLAKKSNKIKISDAKNINGLKIGLINKDVAEEILIQQGVNNGLFDAIADPLTNVRKLALGRVDLIAYGDISAFYMLKNIGENVDDYEVVNVLRETQLYFAFHKDTSDDIIKAFQKSLDKLKKQDTVKYEAILRKYGSS